MIVNILLVGLGGFLGSVFRYLMINFLPIKSESVKIWLINIIGSFLIGFFFEPLKFSLAPKTNLFFMVGIVGSFTTFSTFAIGVTKIFENGRYLAGLIYILAQVIVCVTLATTGLWIGNRIQIF